ncbi:MAG: co-chaperone GroES [Chlamydiae bacterium]|jgi:chaperonin GroES|nr:co-chaperone GroES [Chlamydiota bacterium]
MTALKVKPLGNRILVKRAEAKASKGGILLPESSKEKPKQGEVVAIGPGKIDENGHLEKMQIKIGDKVIFGSYAGVEVKVPHHEQEQYLIMTEDEVLAVVIG